MIVDCLDSNETLLKTLQSVASTTPVLAIIKEHQNKAQIYSSGAYDYISFPIIPSELSLRVKSSFYVKSAEQDNIEALGSSIDSNSNDSILIKKTCSYLTKNLGATHSLNSIAHAMGTNRSFLALSFKQITGTSVILWLRTKRMEKAKHLLSHSDSSIQQISYQLGYQDPANFATAFKQQNKMSPSTYKKIQNQKHLGRIQRRNFPNKAN